MKVVVWNMQHQRGEQNWDVLREGDLAGADIYLLCEAVPAPQRIKADGLRIFQHGSTKGIGCPCYRQVRSVPRRAVEGFEVTTFDPTRRLQIRGTIGPFQARIGYAVEALGGETKLTNAVELTPSSIASTVIGPLAGPRVKAAVASNLEVLKQVLEARSPGIS